MKAADLRARVDLVELARRYGLVLQREGSEWKACCPFHEDDTPSWKIYTGKDGAQRYQCFGCQAKGDAIDFVGRMENLDDPKDAMKRLQELTGNTDIAPRNGNHAKQPKRKTKPGRILATYDYGAFEVVRKELLDAETGEVVGKTFLQRHRGPDGEWVWNLDGIERVLYRLPSVLATDTVWLVEGEKDVHSLEAIGIVATTIPGGAKAKWSPRFTEALRGKHVVLCPDTDAPGQEHAARCIHELRDAAANLSLCRLPEVFKDVTEFLQSGQTRADLEALLEPVMLPDPEPEPVLEPEPEPAPRVTVEGERQADKPDLRWYNFTDAGNAERLQVMFGRDFRFCHEMQKWLVWDGKRWKIDNCDQMKRFAMLTVRQFYLDCTYLDSDVRKAGEKHAKSSESASALNNMILLARSLPGVTVGVNDLDADPWLLNCQNGTIDLKSQKLIEHSREHLITKICAVDYDPSAGCPLFLKFLDRIFDGREAVIDFVSRGIGYSLTGLVGEKAVFCCFGGGDNGKTTLLELFRWIMGEYSAQVLIDTLMAKTQQSNATMADLADLRGARFVTTSEAEEGARLSEGKIKYLTGMGTVKTCRKYENPIEFMPTHKIWMDANHRPIVRGTDKAIWNRLKPLGFTVTIPDSEKDKGLQDKLRAEAKGILNWAVWGCHDWQRNGIGTLPEMEEEKQAWRNENDPLKEFIEECCELGDPDYYVTIPDLRKAYERWAEESGERYPLTRNRFNDRLELIGLRRDFQRLQTVGDWKTFRVWKGIALK